MHVIAFRKEQVEDYVHEFYKKDTYIALYSHLIQPCNGPDLWPEVDGDAILPPIHKIQPGRPKINRRRKDKDEVYNPYRMKRNQTSLRCAHCHQLGHNRRTCRSNQRPPGVATAKGKGKATIDKGKGKLTSSSKKRVFEFISIISLMQKIMHIANVFHMQAASTEKHFMGFRVQVDMAFSSQQSNVCVT